jgi:hypothetical protein
MHSVTISCVKQTKKGGKHSVDSVQGRLLTPLRFICISSPNAEPCPDLGYSMQRNYKKYGALLVLFKTLVYFVSVAWLFIY